MENSWNNLLPTFCDWCPLACGADRSAGKRGACGADNNLYVARSALHYWEEPPISGIVGGPKRGQGPGSGTIFFSNCNMKCVYCQNFQISGVSNKTLGKKTSKDQLVNMMLDLQNQGAMNINFVTGTHYRNHIISAVRAAKEKGLNIPIVWNTSGYETIASVYALRETVDIWLADYKYSSNELAKSLSQNNISDYPQQALEAIEAMQSFYEKPTYDNFNENLRMTKGVIVRHMILPGHLDNSKKCLQDLFEAFGNSIKYSIMNQYTAVIDKNSQAAKEHPELLQSVTENEYEEILDFADSIGIEDYYWQSGATASESFIPDWL